MSNYKLFLWCISFKCKKFFQQDLDWHITSEEVGYTTASSLCLCANNINYITIDYCQISIKWVNINSIHWPTTNHLVEIWITSMLCMVYEWILISSIFSSKIISPCWNVDVPLLEADDTLYQFPVWIPTGGLGVRPGLGWWAGPGPSLEKSGRWRLGTLASNRLE